MILLSYKTKFCHECQSLVFQYEATGDVCNCKNPWEFITEYWEQYSGIDPVRLQWIEVMVKVDDKLT